MIDDTPQVRWSNAWWRLVFFGSVCPLLLMGLLVYCLAEEKAFLLGNRRAGQHSIETVYGFQAQLLWAAYFGAALASFAYGYLQNHPRWNAVANPLLAVGLLTVAIGQFWASLYPVL